MNPTSRRLGEPIVVPSAAGSLVAPATDGAVLFADSENGNLLTIKTASATGTTLGLGIYGDGSDGAFAFDGSTVVAGMTPSTNVYTMTKDLFASSITVSAGVTVKTSGFRLFCTGTTTIAATGSINCNGNAASAGTAGAITNANGSLGAGTAGGNGGAGNNAGSTGTNHAAGFPGGTGAGGAGGGDGTHGAAAAGTYAALAAVKGGGRFLPALLLGQIFGTQSSGTASLVSAFMGGTGGGGGGGNNADATGGGGGGGGGVLVLATQALINNGSVSCDGGAGAAGTSAANNAGGGGGGGGGVCIVVYSAKSGTGTITAAAGTGGAKAGAGGVAGSAGSAGVAITFQA